MHLVYCISRLLRMSYKSSRPQVCLNIFQKTLNNLRQRCADNFREYKNGQLTWNGLKWLNWNYRKLFRKIFLAELFLGKFTAGPLVDVFSNHTVNFFLENLQTIWKFRSFLISFFNITKSIFLCYSLNTAKISLVTAKISL